MNQKLLKNFNQLEQQKTELLQLLDNLSTEKYTLSPAPGKWSIAEILTHLLTAEQLTLGYMRKKNSVIKDLENSGWSSTLRLWVLKVSQRIPLKYKAPKIIVSKTPESPSLEEIKKQWALLRADLKNLLAGIEEADQKKLIFKHTMAGRFNASQAIIFLGEHITHHLPQIKRLLK